MGTDIHMACEVRKNNEWHLVKDKVFINVWYDPDSKNSWFNDKYTNIPFDCRNYDTFAILADVRNGYGFAGCKTGDGFNPISEPKGYPDDMCAETYKYMSLEHSASYLTLREILEYDWTQTTRTFGVLSEEEYKKSILIGEKPNTWCGGVSGQNIVNVTEETMIAIINGDIDRDKDAKYYVGCYFPTETYAEHAHVFYTETIPVLKTLVPENGTEDDVRIVFDFDS